MNYLYAAYGVTWTVILIYVVVLTYGFKKIQDEIQELERK